MKRGQSALEYLVTYGWAILAIVIIGGVLWYTGVFDPARFAGEKQCAGGAAFTCQDFRVNSTGGLTVVLNNKVGGSITGVAVSSGTCTPTSVAANANTTCTVNAFVASGTVGNLFDRTTLSVNYTDTRSAILHTDTVTIRGKYE